MKDKLVVIHNSQPRVGTSLIAVGFERQHKNILKLVSKYKSDFEDFGSLEERKISTKGRPIEEYLLNEDQFLLIGTYFKNTALARTFKKRLVREFSLIRKQLAAVRSQHSDQAWIASRDLGKKQRRALTDALKEYVDYAKEQGSKNAERYYILISRMIYGPLFIFDGKYQNTRDMMSDEQLTTLASAEKIAAKGIRDCMKSKKFYKDIYKDIKSKVLAFAGLTGQTEVIEQQLKLEE